MKRPTRSFDPAPYKPGVLVNDPQTARELMTEHIVICYTHERTGSPIGWLPVCDPMVDALEELARLSYPPRPKGAWYKCDGCRAFLIATNEITRSAGETE